MASTFHSSLKRDFHSPLQWQLQKTIRDWYLPGRFRCTSSIETESNNVWFVIWPSVWSSTLEKMQHNIWKTSSGVSVFHEISQNKPITSWMLPIQHSTLIQWWHTSLNCRTVCRNMNGMCRARKKIRSTYTTSALITQYNRWNAINDMAFWMSGTKWAMNQIESKRV